ncbi:MAG: AMP-binding protein, partial [Desulfobacterales bacterium]
LENLPPPEKPATSMIYTSGTTGQPKGAARGGDAVDRTGAMEYLFNLLGILKLSAEEVHLVCCPLYHSAPSFFNMVTSMLGGTRILQPRFDPEQFLELVAEHKVTSTHIVPTMVSRLLQVPESFTENLDLASLRTVVCGAAPLFPDMKLAFLDRFGPILYEYYGATETGLNTLISPEEMRERPASVGKALAYNDLIILDESGNEVPDGQRGVLYMHNPILMDGYYKNETATAETYHGKHMTVGDVATRDKEGYIYIVDRIKDMIIRGGVNIYPAEIEEVLNAMADIQDVAVVGKPDREFGEAVVAFIVAARGAAIPEETIRDYCAERMANQKIPETIIFIDEIPRTPTGKILKRELRESVPVESED